MENKDLNQIIEELANEIIENIRANMSSYGLGDGNLAKSLEPEIDGNHLKILANDYWDYAMEGRGPGGVPNNFTEILTHWISDRNIQVDDPRRFVNNVKWKTIREGSYLYRHPEEQRDFLSDVLDGPISKFQDKFHIFIKDNIQ